MSNSNYQIQVIGEYPGFSELTYGLEVHGPAMSFPLLVGCSLRTVSGMVIDQPARWLRSRGKAVWSKAIDWEPFLVRSRETAGQIRFKLWRNNESTECLGDTGWIIWEAECLVGYSAAGLNMIDDEIRREYAGRFDVWEAA